MHSQLTYIITGLRIAIRDLDESCLLFTTSVHRDIIRNYNHQVVQSVVNITCYKNWIKLTARPVYQLN